MLHEIQIEQQKNRLGCFDVMIDGNRVKANRVNVKLEVGCLPEIAVSLLGIVNSNEIKADTKIEYSPEMLRLAAEVVQTEIAQNPAWRDAIVASIASVLRTKVTYAQEEQEKLANAITDQLIG